RARAGCGDEQILVYRLVHYLPVEEKYSLLLELILELQDLPEAKDRTMLFARHQNTLRELATWSYLGFLDKLSQARSKEVREAAQELKQEIDAFVGAYAKKGKPAPEKPPPVKVTQEVKFRPVILALGTNPEGKIIGLRMIDHYLPTGDNIDVVR